MTRTNALAKALALLFVGVWAVTAAFEIKFPEMPFLLGPALAFTLFAGGIASLAGTLYFTVLACAGDDA